VEPYISHSRLLPHCDLVVTHGGAGTTLSALFHALPLVVIPLSNDQPFHAMRCAALEVGYVVKRPGQFDPYLFDRHFAELSPGAIREAVETVLGDDRYRRNARRLSDEMMALPGPDRAVALLTQLV
jgi:UDP:flavonoid glycosyltransferase YjiC (YdhE family)